MAGGGGAHRVVEGGGGAGRVGGRGGRAWGESQEPPEGRAASGNVPKNWLSQMRRKMEITRGDSTSIFTLPGTRASAGRHARSSSFLRARDDN
jgi:hypothetical protein